MGRLHLITGTVLAVLAFTAPALASRADADACAAKLPGDAKLIYAETISAVKAGADLRELVRSKTRSLVMGGKLGRANARSMAEAAGGCLKQAM
jgi:hypothetical protein